VRADNKCLGLNSGLNKTNSVFGRVGVTNLRIAPNAYRAEHDEILKFQTVDAVKLQLQCHDEENDEDDLSCYSATMGVA
jgi:hypothetical protein